MKLAQGRSPFSSATCRFITFESNLFPRALVCVSNLLSRSATCVCNLSRSAPTFQFNVSNSEVLTDKNHISLEVGMTLNKHGIPAFYGVFIPWESLCFVFSCHFTNVLLIYIILSKILEHPCYEISIFMKTHTND